MASSIILHTILLLSFLLIFAPTSSIALCKWYGTAPFCFIGNSCPDGCFSTLESSKGDGYTCWISIKKYCCCPKRALDTLIHQITSDDKK
ncbi:hypothetical protein I4U23_020093 [Adineta vaga]|nr:hypothetical protein I4U23_020093 [Adineta vaga]